MELTAQSNPVHQALGVVAVVGLHIVIGYGLMNGLAHKVVEVIRAPIETRIIDDIKPPPVEPPLPPPPPPLLAPPPPPPYVPPPEVKVQQPPPPKAIAAVTRKEPPKAPVITPTPPPVVAPAVRTAAVVDASKGCKTPEYPPASKRLEEAGVVVLGFLIGMDGAVLDSSIVTSSGFPRLDEAARDALGKCKFKPGTIDGRPEQSWARIRYTWKLD